MKLTENRVDTLIDTLNDLICDEQSITREQRENLIKTVATLGGLKERLRLISAEKEARQIAKNEKGKETARTGPGVSPYWKAVAARGSRCYPFHYRRYT